MLSPTISTEINNSITELTVTWILITAKLGIFSPSYVAIHLLFQCLDSYFIFKYTVVEVL